MMAADRELMLLQLHQRIEPLLVKIGNLLPKEYRLTLLARHTTMDNADIVLSVDELPKAAAAIERLDKQEAFTENPEEAKG